MPRKTRLDEGHESVQIEVLIPARQSCRAKSLEEAKGPAPVPPPVARIPRVARLMALAVKFQDMVDRGEVKDYAELARLGYVTRARISQIMNLLLLAPDIQEELLFMPPTVARRKLKEPMLRPIVKEMVWRKQRAKWARGREDVAGSL